MGLSTAEVQFSWDNANLGKGSAVFQITATDGGDCFHVYRDENKVRFTFKSGAPPKGILLPKTGNVVGLPDTGYSNNVRLEPDNHLEGMILVNNWYQLNDVGDKPNGDSILFERWFPYGGGGVPGYIISTIRTA